MTTATQERPTLRLPGELRSYQSAILEALSVAQLRDWPEGEKYHDALQPEAIGHVLVGALHDELVNAEIGYLFREKLTDRDRVRLAQASKVSGKLAHYTHLTFLIEVNFAEWILLPDAKKIAVIDHELCHFTIGEDSEGNPKPALVSHDVEEFNAIVRRWGTWKRDLERFAHAITSYEQLDVFEVGALDGWTMEVPPRASDVTAVH